MLEKSLLVLIFVLSYYAVVCFNIKRRSDKYKKKNNMIVSTKDYSFNDFFQKINFLNSKDAFLSKQGYPLNLNVYSYYMLKTLLALLLLVGGTINYESTIFGIMLGAFGYFSIDIYILINKKTRDGEICVDLMNVVNSISLELSADVTLKETLRRQFENCKNKDFRRAMLEFSTQYELSELNMDKSLEALESKFDIQELDMFCNALREYSSVSNIVEILENLASMLKLKYIEKIKEGTRNKVIYITFGVIVALGNIIALTFYPIMISIGEGFNNIFS
ncbi:MAG: hypothetical protein IKJ32_00615 [Clostridia bacterium]|nr:hypothetical protein [Clostridia bacterium]